MTDAKLKELYTLTCATKGYEPDPGQFKTWRHILGFSDARDLEKAIVEWYTHNLTLPMPAELLPLVGAEFRKRMLPKTGFEYMTAYKCPRCSLGAVGFTAAHEMRCERCWKFGEYVLMSVELEERKAVGAKDWEDMRGAVPQKERSA